MASRKTMRIRMIALGMVLLAGAAGLAGYGLRDGIAFYREPAEVRAGPPADGTYFQLGGLVKAGSWVKGETHEFVVTDLVAEIPARYTGILPDLFREGQGTILKGRMKDGVFLAEEVLAKHDEDYVPKELAETLKERGVYQD